jgi:hypothetical protein
MVSPSVVDHLLLLNGSAALMFAPRQCPAPARYTVKRAPNDQHSFGRHHPRGDMPNRSTGLDHQRQPAPEARRVFPMPEQRTTFPQDQRSHQSGVHHQGQSKSPTDILRTHRRRGP